MMGADWGSAVWVGLGEACTGVAGAATGAAEAGGVDAAAASVMAGGGGALWISGWDDAIGALAAPEFRLWVRPRESSAAGLFTLVCGRTDEDGVAPDAEAAGTKEGVLGRPLMALGAVAEGSGGLRIDGDDMPVSGTDSSELCRFDDASGSSGFLGLGEGEEAFTKPLGAPAEDNGSFPFRSWVTACAGCSGRLSRGACPHSGSLGFRVPSCDEGEVGGGL